MFASLFNRSATTRTAPPIENITAPELNRRREAGEPIFVLDVRAPVEYQYEGHIAGARLLPLPVLPQRLNELPADQPIVIVCRSGNRSLVACEILVSAGFTKVANLGAGMIGWQMAGLPLRK